MPIDTSEWAAGRDTGASGGIGEAIEIGNLAHSAVVIKLSKVAWYRFWRIACAVRRSRIAGLQWRPEIRRIEDVRELCGGQAVRHVREPRQWPEGEHERLRSVGHGRVTVAARDLLALDGTVHVSTRHQISVGTGRKRRRS